MSVRRRLRFLEQAAREDVLEVPQADGTVRTFGKAEAPAALVSLIDGRDHPLAEAARNSSDPRWANSFYADIPIGDAAEDLSEA